MTHYKYQKQHASNYNYKSKRSFGQRIKNFFTIPEEDLKEEPSKEFEKIKLFTLTRGSLFLGILVFMILINILVGFNINFLYIRQILGFLFLILIPGLLIMLCFKIRTVKFWEYLVYTVGLSIAFIMFAGLAVNWTLPALNITDKPLSLWPILICFDIFLIGLWLTAIYRNKDLKPFDITIPKLDTINRIFFIIPIIFPFLSILGAFLLNNHGPNILTMIMLGGIAVYVLLLVIFRKHMNENIWPWALWMIGLALLLMFNMRSWFVNGIDSNLEFSVTQLTKVNGLWNPSLFNNNYNFMLSVTILPNVFSFISNLNDHIISKIVITIIFSFIPIVLFLVFNKNFNKSISTLSALFFIFQPMFTEGIFGIPPRQEISFLFFGLTILVLFTDNLNNLLRKIIFVIFGASIIVSHYSTAYIALAIFSLSYIFILIYKIYEYNKIKKGRIHHSQRYEFYLTGVLILLLLLFSFLWYNQVTDAAEGLINFTKKSFSNLENMFSEEVQIRGQTIFGNLNVFDRKMISPSLSNYSSYLIDKHQVVEKPNNFYNIDKDYSIQPQKTFSYKESKKYSGEVLLLRGIFRVLGMLIICIGFIIILLNKNKIKLETFILMIVCILILSLITILPFSSIKYDTGRTYQQSLMILAPLEIFGLMFLFKYKEYSHLFISLFLILYLLLLSNFIQQFYGGNTLSMSLSNFGSEHDILYVYKQDLLSGRWIYSLNNDSAVYVDEVSYRKLILSSDPIYKNNLIYDLFPRIILKESYVYASYFNVFNEVSFRTINNRGALYSFPDEFLGDNKNKIYNNGGSEIFK